MRAIGLLAGVGSLLWEARSLGFKILGNVDTRSYFRTAPWVWRSNFTEPFYSDPASVPEDEWFEADLALGHPPCGSFSMLGQVGAYKYRPAEDRTEWHARRAGKPGLLPLFTQLVRRYQPKVFALDNLPKALKVAAPPEWWERELPGYRLTYLIVRNWDYGSPQNRIRLWIIGSRGKRAFTFKPVKTRLPGPTSAWDAFKDLPWEPWENIEELAHVHSMPDTKPHGSYWGRTPRGKHRNFQHVAELAMGFCSLPHHYLWAYKTRTGRYAKKAGRTRCALNHTCRVISGLATLHHPVTGWPLTARERARCMGWPDEFKLWDGKVEFSNTNIIKLVKLTGKAVPSEFPRYLIPQLRRHARRI